ncbi:LysR family transcriptional regulator [Streptomyces griseocarneus]|uniref:LysR family transcriptional regulator n=1 Tax=Streptomyces griseocarneus TaxID=51201 RepID=UPI00167CC5B9|nr:LysR family transcriptional regulator [Streptomyces griseocarneus]MBZ6475691.1 LysR family transcriptional regulator [Streptomyces griseocarneus]GHG68846.1 LysR family transcriptional regulator [Streptomyces griseocarneus]
MTRGNAPDPSVHQLRLLLVLSEELHFGRAAHRLFISQPTLSRHIQALEATLGVALVERSTRRVELTAAGEALLPHVRATVEAADGLRQAAGFAARASELSGRLVLGAYVTALPVIRTIVERIHERHPGLEVELCEVGFDDQAHALLEGRADAVLCFGPVPPGLQAMEVAAEPRLVCLPDTHPLAYRDRVTLNELSDLPTISLAERIPRMWRDYWAADPRPDGTAVRYTDHNAASLEAIVSAVGLGQGVAFVAGTASDLFPRPGIRYVEVTDLPPCSAILAWSAARRDEAALVALRGVVRETCAAGVAAGPDARWWDASPEFG